MGFSNRDLMRVAEPDGAPNHSDFEYANELILINRFRQLDGIQQVAEPEWNDTGIHFEYANELILINFQPIGFSNLSAAISGCRTRLWLNN